MLFSSELKTVFEASTGGKYVTTTKRDAIPIPKRFYCKWNLPGDEIQYDKNGKELIDDKDKRCCFNHRIGLPARKWESDTHNVNMIPVPLTHFNKRMMDNYFKHRKYSQNKCRGSGATEILSVRYMIFKYAVLNTVYNRKCIIIPGTSRNLSGEFSTRIKQVCDKIPQVYRIIPASEKPLEFIFKSGGRIVLTSATPDADRGFENVGDIIQEEVAHWELIDDSGVYYASEGVYDKTRCHIVHSTTPRSKRGFYYDLVWSPSATSDFYKHVTNWREVVGLPVQRVEDLYRYHGIDDNLLAKLRKEYVEKFKTDTNYRAWYIDFFTDEDGFIPIEELIDVPIPIIDINAVIDDSRTDRTHYDQELDNQFVSGENRAIGMFAEVDMNPDDLAGQLQRFREGIQIRKEFNAKDYE